jgi:MFS family permease
MVSSNIYDKSPDQPNVHVGLDTTIAATVQASVYEDLGNIEKLGWIGIGFPLGSVAVILFIGKLFGTFEIKWLQIGSVVLFEAGSALCGAAPNSDALIVGRVIAGVGGAGMYIGYCLPSCHRHDPMLTVCAEH